MAHTAFHALLFPSENDISCTCGYRYENEDNYTYKPSGLVPWRCNDDVNQAFRSGIVSVFHIA